MANLNYLEHDMDRVSHLDVPETLIELLELLRSAPEGTVWRGQTYYLWPPVPTLYRRLRLSGLSDGQINESAVGLVESRLIADARAQGILATDGSILEFMACLQHHGGATRLLDVTTSYQVALYFACSGQPDAVGSILAYSVNPENRIVLASGRKLVDWDELLKACEDQRPRLVVPPAYDRRIEAQCGAFLLAKLGGTLAEPNPYTNQTYDTEVKSIYVSPEVKREVMAYLSSEGITKGVLFPDIESFARGQLANVPVYL